jgi:hypothetical protein
MSVLEDKRTPGVFIAATNALVACFTMGGPMVEALLGRPNVEYSAAGIVLPPLGMAFGLVLVSLKPDGRIVYARLSASQRRVLWGGLLAGVAASALIGWGFRVFMSSRGYAPRP